MRICEGNPTRKFGSLRIDYNRALLPSFESRRMRRSDLSIAHRVPKERRCLVPDVIFCQKDPICDFLLDSAG